MARTLAPSTRSLAPAAQDALFTVPFSQQQGLPNGFVDSLNQAGQAYRNAYNTHSWTSQHPFLTGTLGAIVGGPAGAFALPMVAKNNDMAAHAALLKSFLDHVQNSVSSLSQLNPIAESTHRGMIGTTALQNMGLKSPIPSNAPISDQTLQTLLNGGSAGRQLQEGLGIQRGAITNPATLPPLNIPPSASTPTQPKAQDAFGRMGGDTSFRDIVSPQSQPITLSANATAQGPEPPLQPYSYSDPALAQTTLTTLGPLVQKAAELKAEEGKRGAETQKLVAEAAKAHSEGRKADADAALNKIKALWYPKEAQAKIGKDNRSGGGGGGHAPLPTAASELAGLYHAGAFGKPGTPEAMRVYSAIQANDPSGYVTKTSNTLDANGHVVSSVSQRVPVGATTQSSPGGVAIKGKTRNWIIP